MADAPIRAVVVDDEPLAREGIRMLLAADAEIAVVGECASGREAVEVIRTLGPDLVFLDVQMPEMDGFEVLRALEPERAKKLPAVVFVTAHDRYALKAFEVHALDYLLKPFDDDRFREALSRVKSQLKLARVSELSRKLVALLESEPRPEKKPGTEYLARLAIKDVGRVVFLNVDEIDWIEAADYYVQLHAGPKTYLHRETMQSLEEKLDPRRFFRIHRSAIVNGSRVKELRSQGRRDVSVVLITGAELRVARSCRARLESLIGGESSPT